MPKGRKPQKPRSIKDVLYEGLTPKEYKFCQEYIKNGGNATQAAIKAYPDTDYVTHRAIGYENLTKPHIIDYIDGELARESNGIPILFRELWKDVRSKDKDLRKNAQQLLVKAFGLGNTQNIKVEDMRKELESITYGSFNEKKDDKDVVKV